MDNAVRFVPTRATIAARLEEMRPLLDGEWVGLLKKAQEKLNQTTNPETLLAISRSLDLLPTQESIAKEVSKICTDILAHYERFIAQPWDDVPAREDNVFQFAKWGAHNTVNETKLAA